MPDETHGKEINNQDCEEDNDNRFSSIVVREYADEPKSERHPELPAQDLPAPPPEQTGVLIDEATLLREHPGSAFMMWDRLLWSLGRGLSWSHETEETYSFIVREYIEGYLPEDPRLVSPVAVMRWKQKLAERGLAENTRKKAYQLLARLMAQATTTELITVNRVEQVELAKRSGPELSNETKFRAAILDFAAKTHAYGVSGWTDAMADGPADPGIQAAFWHIAWLVLRFRGLRLENRRSTDRQRGDA